MKAAICAASFVLAGALAFGQRGGGFGSGSKGPGGLSQGLPPVRPIPPFGSVGPRFPGRPGRGFFANPSGFPLAFGGYDYDYPPPVYEPPPPPPPIVTPPPVYVLPPPPPVRSDIREYKTLPETQPEAAGAAEPRFAIALKDGSVRYAIATFVQGDALAYVDPDGRQQRVAGDELDRETTRRLNQALRLSIYLPPPRN